MADILRVTTPLINKNQPVQPKPGVDPTAAFDLPETSRIYQPQNKSELLRQNNSMFKEGDAPTLLLNLLKDPAVAASYLKNILLLEEIFKLVPANNKTFTQEIEQAFDQMMLQGSDIAAEMERQGTASTVFHGEIFDFLRQLSSENPDQPETQGAIANMLKALNNQMRKEDILDAVANSLIFLKENFSSSKSMSAKLDALLARYRAEGAGDQFHTLKNDTLALFKEMEESVLYNPKIEKNLSITIYNLSRFNDSMDSFQEAAFYLRQQLSLPQRQRFMQLVDGFLKALRQGTPHAPQKETAADDQLPLPEGMGFLVDERQENSRVMDALVKIIGKQSQQEADGTVEAGKTEKIIHSLLSSPCNFTPLLHFVIPAVAGEIKAFAEIWVNPDSDEKDMPPGAGPGRHLLLVIDVDAVGRFEVELFVHDKTIDFSLFCPPGYEKPYEKMVRELPKLMASYSYRAGTLRLETMERSRSLMDVFKSLPYKRVGVDVKI